MAVSVCLCHRHSGEEPRDSAPPDPDRSPFHPEGGTRSAWLPHGLCDFQRPDRSPDGMPLLRHCLHGHGDSDLRTCVGIFARGPGIVDAWLMVYKVCFCVGHLVHRLCLQYAHKADLACKVCALKSHLVQKRRGAGADRKSVV